jgi:hypothetical protein
MLAGMFRFVCSNGLVCGDTVADVRVPHKGDVAGHVIEGAYEVLHGFDRVQESRDAMRAITLDAGESEVFARAALALKYDEDKPAPITESQILMPRRFDDRRRDLWSVFNRTQENLTKGGLPAAPPTAAASHPPVQGIDRCAPESRPVAAGRWPAPVESLNPHAAGAGSSPCRFSRCCIPTARSYHHERRTQNRSRAIEAAAPLEAADPTKNLILVPLSRLVPRPKRNVRKTPRMSIPELAASIPRRPAAKPDRDCRRRWRALRSRGRWPPPAALKLLAKKNRIAADWEVPCLLVADGTPAPPASPRTCSAKPCTPPTSSRPSPRWWPKADPSRTLPPISASRRWWCSAA